MYFILAWPRSSLIIELWRYTTSNRGLGECHRDVCQPSRLFVRCFKLLKTLYEDRNGSPGKLQRQKARQNVCQLFKARRMCVDAKNLAYQLHRTPNRNKVSRSRTSNATSQRIDSRRMLHVVNSQNVFHELCFKTKTILYHVDLSFFASSNSVYFLHELKQRSSDVTVQHQWLVDSEVLLGSTLFKGKAEIQARVSQLFQKTTPSSNGHPNTCERILRNYNKHTTY